MKERWRTEVCSTWADLTLSSSSVSNSLIRWSSASSMSDSSSRPERHSVFVVFENVPIFWQTDSAVSCESSPHLFVVPVRRAQRWLWSADWRCSLTELKTRCCTETDGRLKTHSLLMLRDETHTQKTGTNELKSVCAFRLHGCAHTAHKTITSSKNRKAHNPFWSLFTPNYPSINTLKYTQNKVN